MKEALFQWYLWLTAAGNAVGEPLRALLDGGAPAGVSALIFGVLGSLSPCQFTANLSAFTYASQRPSDSRYGLRVGAVYTVGKVAAYTLIGGAALALGAALEEKATSFIVPYRRALGPLMILVGLYFFGVYRLRFGFGHRLSGHLAGKAPGEGTAGAFLLGFGYSFSFCPTLFVLFFAWVLPLSLRSPGGVLFPGLFGVGTALPLLAAVGLLVAGGKIAERWMTRMGLKVERPLRWLAGAVFVLAGLHDTLVYWAI